MSAPHEATPIPHAATAATIAPADLPHAVQSALAPDEIVILHLRPSAAYVVLSSLGTLAAAAMIAATLAYAARLPWSPWSEPQALVIGGTVAGLRLAIAWLDWFMHVFVLTDRRVIARRGIVRTALYEAPLARIQNTIVVQSVRERLFGLGTLGFATAGRGTFDCYWEMVRRPFEVHRVVREAVERYGRR